MIHQIASQLLKLVDVVSVEDMTSGEHLERELLLVKLEVPAGKRSSIDPILARNGARVISDKAAGLIVELTSSEGAVTRLIEELATVARVCEVVRSGALGISQAVAQGGAGRT